MCPLSRKSCTTITANNMQSKRSMQSLYRHQQQTTQSRRQYPLPTIALSHQRHQCYPATTNNTILLPTIALSHRRQQQHYPAAKDNAITPTPPTTLSCRQDSAFPPSPPTIALFHRRRQRYPTDDKDTPMLPRHRQQQHYPATNDSAIPPLPPTLSHP